jgi:hypothetical protein
MTNNNYGNKITPAEVIVTDIVYKSHSSTEEGHMVIIVWRAYPFRRKKWISGLVSLIPFHQYKPKVAPLSTSYQCHNYDFDQFIRFVLHKRPFTLVTSYYAWWLTRRWMVRKSNVIRFWNLNWNTSLSSTSSPSRIMHKNKKIVQDV